MYAGTVEAEYGAEGYGCPIYVCAYDVKFFEHDLYFSNLYSFHSSINSWLY
jgi:hypothetical protein